MHGLPCEDPAHVGPETAVARGMRVTILVSILVMHAMRGHPKNRPAFQSQRAAHGKKIFHPFGCLKASMSEKPVVTNADSKAAGNPPQYQRKQQCLPTKYEYRRQGTKVKHQHEKSSHPNDRLGQSSVVPEYPGHGCIISLFHLI